MSLARKEKKKDQTRKEKKKNIKKEIKEKFVIYNVGDCFSLYFISMTLSFSFRSSGQYLVSDAGSPFFFFRSFIFFFVSMNIVNGSRSSRHHRTHRNEQTKSKAVSKA